jgi:hypothetical protein
MDAELRAAFTAMGVTGDELESRILASAQERHLTWSPGAARGVQTTSTVAVDVSPNELRRLSESDRAIWLGLLSHQAKVVREELAKVSASLSPGASNTDKALSSAAPPGADLIASPKNLVLLQRSLTPIAASFPTLLTDNLAISASAIPQRSNTNDLMGLLSEVPNLGARISRTLAALSNNRQPAEQ